MLIRLPQNQRVFGLLLTVTLVILSLLLSRFGVLQRWNNLFYDLESTVVAKPADDRIVIVAIDNASLQKLGRWPWSRAIHARLIEQLTAVKVTAIGLDILFMEPDIRHQEDDQLLAAAIARNNHVVLPVLSNQQNNKIISKPISIFSDRARLAHVNLQFDSQGIVRRFLIRMRSQGMELPSMALALSRFTPGFLESSALQQENEVLINFSNPPGQFKQLSYVDVLLDSQIRKRLRNKIVLIGTTASGLSSRIATPVSKKQFLMSGIELQANALNTLLSGKTTRPLNELSYALLSLFLIATPISLFVLMKPGYLILITLAAMAVTFLASVLLLNLQMFWFAPISTLLCQLFSLPFWSWYRLKQLNHSLFKEHEQMSATLKAVGEAVISTDQKGDVEFMNTAAEQMLDYTLIEAKQHGYGGLFEIIEQRESSFATAYGLTPGESDTEIQILRNRNDREFAVRISNSPVYREDGTLVGTVHAINDISEIIHANKKIIFAATHDELTGLPNRVLLQDRLEQGINRATREQSLMALLFIDLDDFKKINDALGHACGDLLLQETSERLRRCVRLSDTIARWGGDEFIVLLTNLHSQKDATEISNKLLQSLSQSFYLFEHEVFVTPSIGISLCPDDGLKTDRLMEKADTAMYSVKQKGGKGFCFYSQRLENNFKQRLTLEIELRQAISHNEFEMYYQPQIEFSSGKMVGAEALIRWMHPDKGTIAPDQFIHVAEETGLIVAIGEWVISSVCSQLKSWNQQGLPLLNVAINLSPQQFLERELVSFIIREMNRYQLSGKALQMEITESMLVQDINRVINILDNLKSAGISIAIDDFGTGYSSLEYLKRFPIDKLKIDKSFIGNVLTDNDDASIVHAVIALGHNMNMKIIAEGIETEQQASFLKHHFCDFGQGYFFSKPLSVKDMSDFIKTNSVITQHVF